MQSLILCRFNGSFATTTCARQGDELISTIPSERSLETSCWMKSWSSLLKRLDLRAIGLQSRSRHEKKDGSSIIAAETAQTGAEFGKSSQVYFLQIQWWFSRVLPGSYGRWWCHYKGLWEHHGVFMCRHVDWGRCLQNSDQWRVSSERWEPWKYLVSTDESSDPVVRPRFDLWSYQSFPSR